MLIDMLLDYDAEQFVGGQDDRASVTGVIDHDIARAVWQEPTRTEGDDGEHRLVWEGLGLEFAMSVALAAFYAEGEGMEISIRFRHGGDRGRDQCLNRI